MSPVPQILLIDPEIRAMLDQELIRRGYGQLDNIVELLHQHGVTVSRSTLGRYSQRLRRKIEAIQASTEAARAIAGIADDADDRSGAAIALVQAGLFDALLAMRECEEEGNGAADRIEIQAKAARAIADLTRASIQQKQFAVRIQEEQLRKLNKLTDEAGPRRLDLATLQVIRQEVYGVG